MPSKVPQEPLQVPLRASSESSQPQRYRQTKHLYGCQFSATFIGRASNPAVEIR